MLRGSFCAGRTCELQTLDGIMWKEHYVEIPKQYLKPLGSKLKLWHKWIPHGLNHAAKLVRK